MKAFYLFYSPLQFAEHWQRQGKFAREGKFSRNEPGRRIETTRIEVLRY